MKCILTAAAFSSSFALLLACGPVPTTSGTGGTGGTTANKLPCGVEAVLRAKCQRCHAATPLFGAPMPLVTYADTQQPARSNPALKVWQVMKTQVDSRAMPQGDQLSPAELQTLDSWFAASAPASSEVCTGGGIDPSTLAGPQYLPCTPTRFFKSHAAGNVNAKYPVPIGTNDKYVCFNFKSPFAAGEQATAWAPIVDDARVVHHWILYGNKATVEDGSIGGCSDAANGSILTTQISAWAPGGTNTVLDSDVSLNLDYPSFTMQVHYNNAQYADGADASGYAVCTTPTARQNVAGIVTLGSALFSIPPGANDYAVTGTCSNLALNGQSTMVIETFPHMHKLGSGFRTEQVRFGATLPDLSTIPMDTWSFEAQRHFKQFPRKEVRPGDVLRTTCYYDNPGTVAVKFGNKTSDEMCFDFLLVYPFSAANRLCAL